MKLPSLLTCALALTIGTLFIVGCASTSSGGYKLKQTRNDVDWAMTRYHNRLAFGFLPPQEQQRVSDAYKSYQSAFNVAVKQANGDYTTPTPANVKQLADQLISILDSIP